MDKINKISYFKFCIKGFINKYIRRLKFKLKIDTYLDDDRLIILKSERNYICKERLKDNNNV